MEIVPMIPALTIEGDGPTNRIKSKIRMIVTIPDTLLGSRVRRVIFTRFVSIVIFIPDKATICNVPVVTSASLRDGSSDVFTPNTIPDNRPAWGSGRKD